MGRVPGETSAAYWAFCDYHTLGPRRSVRLLTEIYRRETKDFARIMRKYKTRKVPARSNTTVEKWCARFHWLARIARFEEIEKHQLDERRKQRRMQLEDENWQTGSELRQKCADFLTLMEQFKKTHSKTDVDDEGNKTTTVFLELNTTVGQLAQGLKIANELQEKAVADNDDDARKLNGGSLLGALVHELDALLSPREDEPAVPSDGE